MLTSCGGLPRNVTHAPDRVSGSLGPPASQPATAAEWADLTIKLDEARAEVNRKAAELEAKARNEAKIVDACRWLGLAMIPGGIAVAIFVSRKLGIWIAAAGAMCFALGMFLGRLAPWVDWAAAGGIGFAFLYGVGSSFTTLWTRWQTDKQARKQDDMAAGMEFQAKQFLHGKGIPMTAPHYGTSDPTKLLAQAAALRASAAQLRHVGTVGYDPSRTDPSAEAVKLITGGEG